MKSLLMMSFLICMIAALPVLGASVGTPSGPSSSGPAAPPFAGPGDPIVGNPPDANTGNCFPWGCGYNAEYQQVYNSGQFGASPILITDLEFYNTAFNNNATAMNTGNWKVSLSTTAADWNSLSTTFASNIGADNTVVFNGNLSQPWAFGDTLVVHLSTPFLYNPGAGNLLMDVVGSGITVPSNNIYFDTNGANTPNNFMSRDYCPSGIACANGVVNTGYGLVTGFNESAVTPEPAHTALALMGLLGALALLRRKLASSR